jgi:outer membrane autotransporter protein
LIAICLVAPSPLPAHAQFLFLEGLSGNAPVAVPAVGTPFGAIVGTDSTGTISFSSSYSGTITITPPAILGKAGSGVFTIDGATIAGGEFHIFDGAVAQTSGNTSVAFLSVGSGIISSPVSALNVSGGAIAFGTAVQVGDFGGVGTVNQTGGSVMLGGRGIPVSLNIGNQSGNGAYNLSGGALSFDGTDTTSFVTIGRNGLSSSPDAQTPSTGVLNLSGGEMTLTNATLFIGSDGFASSGVAGSGTINQTGGTLTIDSGSRLFLAAAGNGIYNLNGGTLQIGGDSSLFGNFNDLGGAYAFNLGGGTIEVIGSPLVGTVNATLVDGTTSTINTNGIGATWSGVLSGGGGLAKAGGGTLTLSGPNTYTGATTIAAGALAAGAVDTLPHMTAVTIQAPGTLDLNGFNQSIGSLAGAGAVTLGNATLTTGNDNTNTNFSGVMSGNGALNKVGTGTFVLAGDNTYTGGTLIAAGTLQLGDGGTSGSLIGGVINNGELAFDRGNTLIIDGIISGSGSISQIGSGTTILDASSSYTGGTNVVAGALVDGDFAHPTAALSGGGPIAVEAGGTFGGYGAVTGSVVNSGIIAAGSASPGSADSPVGTFTINGNLLNQGTIQLASGVSIGNALDVRGNYTGAGGTVNINTFLGDDSSRSDRLVINGGAATGSTALHVTNVGGPGADTTNGILVVHAVNGGTTTSDAFSLANGELRAGAFDYDLFRGGVAGNADSWFLRSDFTSGGGGGGVVPPINPLPPTPPPNPLPPGVSFPIVGPELATYGVVQPLARQLGVAILGMLDDRVGDTYDPDGCGVPPPPEASSVDLPTNKATLPTRKAGLSPCALFSPSVWGRFFGQTIDNHYQAYADPRASGNMGGVQVGLDLLRGPVIPGGYDRMGLYGGYGNVNSDVTGLVTNPAATAYVLTHTGSMSLNAWSGGAYWTHIGRSGGYLDGVVQGTGYGGSAGTQFASLNTDGWGFLASLEGGYPFQLPQFGPGFALEPQGQILWQKVSFRHDYDGEGDVALGDTTGPSGRLGLRAKWTIVTASGQVWQPYLTGNVWRDWGAEATTTFSGVDQVPLLTQATMLEFGGGLTGRINANVSALANVDYEFAIGSGEDKRNGVRGALGLKYAW